MTGCFCKINMVKQLLRMCEKKLAVLIGQFNSIFSGFEEIDAETKSLYKMRRAKAVKAREQLLQYITNKAEHLEQSGWEKKLN